MQQFIFKYLSLPHLKILGTVSWGFLAGYWTQHLISKQRENKLQQKNSLLEFDLNAAFGFCISLIKKLKTEQFSVNMPWLSPSFGSLK